ncbi:MAG: hypothetical protein WBV94_33370 [Blastocatellia bacterium]
MTCEIQTIYAARVNASAVSRLHRVILSTILLIAIAVTTGCNRLGSIDPGLVGSWSTGATGSLILKADGAYEMTLKGTFPLESVINNESGRWGAKNGQLNLRNDKSEAISTYDSKLIGKDELQVILVSPLNPNRVTITYRRSPNP